MTVYFPSYYKDFKCIADKCRHSCCENWAVTLDEATHNKYQELGGDLGEKIRSCVSDSQIELCDGRCPFLREDRLCQIISELGEKYISDICREHPRFYHSIAGRTEGGIGASCEEATRLILSCERIGDFIPLDIECDAALETDFNTLSHRNRLYELLNSRELSFNEKIEKIKAEYLISDNIHTDSEWNEILSELEYLEDDHKSLIRVREGGENESIGTYLLRFLAYLIFRHVSPAESYENLRARLLFCLLLCRIAQNAAELLGGGYVGISDAVRIISEEIEYSEENTEGLIFELECSLI